MSQINEDFYVISVVEYINAAIGFCSLVAIIYVTYYLTEKKEDSRMIKEKLNERIDFISKSINSFDDNYFCDKFKSESFTLLKKKIDRSIYILRNYKDEYKYNENYQIIKSSFEDIQNTISNHITNPSEIRSVLCDIQLKIDKIDSECDKIFMILFKTK